MPPVAVNLDEAVQTAAAFLDEHIVKHHGFAPSGEIDDFVIEFQETYAGEDDTVVVVFVVRPEDDPDEPSPEALALARQCCDALVAAHPDVGGYSIAFEFLH